MQKHILKALKEQKMAGRTIRLNWEVRMEKLIDDILELILGDMGCRHEQDHDEDGVHMSVEYSLNDETRLRGMVKELIEQYGRMEI